MPSTPLDRHLVVGAGPVGRHVAELLAARGSSVTVVTRSGRDTGIPGVRHVALDASDADALSRLGWTVEVGDPTPKGTLLDVVVTQV